MSTNTQKTKRTVTKTRTQSSVENGIKILKTAIKKELSLSEASRQHSFGRNYLSDLKARISNNYKNRTIDKERYQTFKNLLKEYNKL